MCAAAVPEVFQVVGAGVHGARPACEPERFFRVLDAANGCPVNAIRVRAATEKTRPQKKIKKIRKMA